MTVHDVGSSTGGDTRGGSASGARPGPGPAAAPGRARGDLGTACLANLGLGLPAIVPLSLAWWLLTEYAPMDCDSVADLARTDLVDCDYTTLDHGPVVMFVLAVTGVALLAVLLAVDVVLPRTRGRRRRTWLACALLVPVPFAVCLLLARV